MAILMGKRRLLTEMKPILLLLLAASAFAQVQRGYVRRDSTTISIPLLVPSATCNVINLEPDKYPGFLMWTKGQGRISVTYSGKGFPEIDFECQTIRLEDPPPQEKKSRCQCSCQRGKE